MKHQWKTVSPEICRLSHFFPTSISGFSTTACQFKFVKHIHTSAAFVCMCGLYIQHFCYFFFLPIFFTFILSQPSVTEPVFHHHFSVLSLARFSVFHLRAFSWNGACERVSSLQEWSVRGTYYLCVDSTQPSRILIRFSALLPWGDKAVDGKDLLTGAVTRLRSL